MTSTHGRHASRHPGSLLQDPVLVAVWTALILLTTVLVAALLTGCTPVDPDPADATPVPRPVSQVGDCLTHPCLDQLPRPRPQQMPNRSNRWGNRG